MECPVTSLSPSGHVEERKTLTDFEMDSSPLSDWWPALLRYKSPPNIKFACVDITGGGS